MGDWAAAYRERVQALAARLDGPDAPQQREALRGELIALGKSLERDLAELTTLKEEAKELVEKWKALKLTTAPAFEAERPVVADHIGASTFIEKGWSRISLGDYPAAETALSRALELSPGISGTHDTLGQIAFLQHDYLRAKAEFEKESTGLSRLQGLAMTLPRLGDRAGGDRAYAKMQADYGENARFQQAEVLAQRGDRTAALDMLERAYASNDSGLVLLLSDPLLAPLAGEARFRELARKIGLTGS